MIGYIFLYLFPLFGTYYAIRLGRVQFGFVDGRGLVYFSQRGGGPLLGDGGFFPLTLALAVFGQFIGFLEVVADEKPQYGATYYHK